MTHSDLSYHTQELIYVLRHLSELGVSAWTHFKLDWR